MGGAALTTFLLPQGTSLRGAAPRLLGSDASSQGQGNGGAASSTARLLAPTAAGRRALSAKGLGRQGSQPSERQTVAASLAGGLGTLHELPAWMRWISSSAAVAHSWTRSSRASGTRGNVRKHSTGKLRTAMHCFGPWPAAPPPTADDLASAEFAREMMLEADPRAMQYSDDLRRCVDCEDWYGAVNVLEEMWKNRQDPDSWSYSVAIDCCLRANETESLEAAAKLQGELDSWGSGPQVTRFQLTPLVSWGRELKRAACGAINTLDWKGREPMPNLPLDDFPCWLLPSQDDAAEHIAEYESQLRHAGWKIVTSEWDLISVLRSKGKLHEHVEALNLTQHMAQRFSTAGEASYPCILKPAESTFGRNTHVVYDSEEVLRIVKPGKIYEIERQIEQQAEYYAQHFGEEEDPEEAWAKRSEQIETATMEWIGEAQDEELGSQWVLQELIPGKYEYSTTLLVDHGVILDSACSRYEFESDVYVWPHLEYIRPASYVSVPEGHLEVMSAILTDFSGICNFNYKLRPNGDLAIFEVNPRVGGDLVFDVPKKRVRSMLEKLDAMF
eukprot:TRINITY_DN75781_c0_g1_i1.p1 TRINITY_DN75781_c0_g1~~TRINITY_DN75781_c0_g1_i1.p1  ORF type:complete len:558 (+),score=87.05 TRINITY_DN75781_c0_g1_i1:100-1773(+)